MKAPSLSAAFLAALSPGLREAAQGVPTLQEDLASLHARATAAWPELRVEGATFAAYVGARVNAASLEAGLESLFAEHLWLAAACTLGDARAQSLFERRMLQPALRIAPEETREELGQRLRQKLLTGARPRLLEYAGRGALLAWLGMVVRRELIDLKREAHRDQAGGKRSEELTPTLADVLAADPELRLAREQAKDALAKALNGALASLAPEDRRMLRMHHLDGVPHGQIGHALGVPRSTVAYRLAQARDGLLERARALLTAELKLNDSEVDSLIGMARSHFELSFSVLKREP